MKETLQEQQIKNHVEENVLGLF